MCIACDQTCCAEVVSPCGCSDCENPECWPVCDVCRRYEHECECEPEAWDDTGVAK